MILITMIYKCKYSFTRKLLILDQITIVLNINMTKDSVNFYVIFILAYVKFIILVMVIYTQITIVDIHVISYVY